MHSQETFQIEGEDNSYKHKLQEALAQPVGSKSSKNKSKPISPNNQLFTERQIAEQESIYFLLSKSNRDESIPQY